MVLQVLFRNSRENPVPDLMPLLAPGEEIIYSPRLHWINGWPFFAGSLLFIALTFYTFNFWFLVGVAVFEVLYNIPLRTNQIAITNYRLLLRVGRWKLRLNDIASDHLNHYQFTQTPFTNMLGTGELVLHLNKGKDLVPVTLPYLQKPMVFLEALGTLNSSLRGHVQ